MLNKDQYNQEEYNNYYQQEMQGAEISQGGSGESSGGKGAIFAVLGLIILGVGGYFGYKAFSQGSDNTTDETLVVQHEVEQPSASIQVAEESQGKEETSENSPKESPKNTQVEQITHSVQSVANDNAQMSPEEIAKVVQMVMTQMNKNPEEIVKETSKKVESDTALLSALSDTDVDSVKEESSDTKNLEEALKSIEETQNTTVKQSSVKVDTYNKVNVESSSSTDELSQLSSQISSLMEENDITPTKTTSSSSSTKSYTESIKKEVVVRSNEMRIIVVKKGDTLGKIAKRAYGNVMEYKKIYRANPDMLNRPDRIYIGQKLRIPK